MGRSLADLLNTRVPAIYRERLVLVEDLAETLGLAVHLVGGTARDLLLDRPLGDLDLLVEGDAAPLAAALAGHLGCAWRRHAPFGTAEILDPVIRTDFASARTETYPEPATLPLVSPGSLEEDLARRDFTVNAMAIRIGGPRHGELTDLHGGRDDLDRRILRVLHRQSFIDDPTRMLRGVRFESRLGLRFESSTEDLAREAMAAGMLERLSGARWRHDLLPLLDLYEVPLARLGSLGILRRLDPELDYGPAVDTRIAAVRKALSELPSEQAWHAAGLSTPALWRLHLTALAWDLASPGRRGLAERLDLERFDRDVVVSGPPRIETTAAALAGSEELVPHRVEELLRPLTAEELVFVAAAGESQAIWVRLAIERLLPLGLTIRGADLLQSGAPQGPAVGQALRETRRARLDGRLEATEELDFAVGLLHAGVGEGEA